MSGYSCGRGQPQESALLFHYVDPRDLTQIVKVGNRWLYLLIGFMTHDKYTVLGFAHAHGNG